MGLLAKRGDADAGRGAKQDDKPGPLGGKAEDNQPDRFKMRESC